MSENSKIENSVFSHPVRTLDAADLDKVVGGFPLDGVGLSGPKDQGGNDNHSRRDT